MVDSTGNASASDKNPAGPAEPSTPAPGAGAHGLSDEEAVAELRQAMADLEAQNRKLQARGPRQRSLRILCMCCVAAATRQRLNNAEAPAPEQRRTVARTTTTTTHPPPGVPAALFTP